MEYYICSFCLKEIDENGLELSEIGVKQRALSDETRVCLECEDCSRNMKKCKLRGALLDCNIAKYHDSDVICEYKQI